MDFESFILVLTVTIGFGFGMGMGRYLINKKLYKREQQC